MPFQVRLLFGMQVQNTGFRGVTCTSRILEREVLLALRTEQVQGRLGLLEAFQSFRELVDVFALKLVVVNRDPDLILLDNRFHKDELERVFLDLKCFGGFAAVLRVVDENLKKEVGQQKTEL